MNYPFSPAFRATLQARCIAFPRIVHDDAELQRAAVALALVPADDGSGEAAFLLTRRASRVGASASTLRSKSSPSAR